MGRAQRVDLSCQACEFMQVLRSVQSSSDRIHGYGGSVCWLVDNLPDDSDGMRALSKTLHLRREKVHGRGNGKDLQSGGSITLGLVDLSLDAGCARRQRSETWRIRRSRSGDGPLGASPANDPV